MAHRTHNFASVQRLGDRCTNCVCWEVDACAVTSGEEHDVVARHVQVAQHARGLQRNITLCFHALVVLGLEILAERALVNRNVPTRN
eukprot:CAMPEP_0117524892 /NCGR_PEP_ID=MMETSP0784-20121206/35484_1 /TAXON_ID=39447 /ORGANISM="" /LENGTH=86 /DNA_ID=CAMNT_0005321063 /DNA_START=457 /DNA_END=717 /DNA_ORIENTATION=-